MSKKQSDMHNKMRSRNRALGLILGALVILIAVVTFYKMGGGS